MDKIHKACEVILPVVGWFYVANVYPFMAHLNNLDKITGEAYQQTDREFLESEKDTFRDDGSTASTAVLVGNHLYVANVGDSRTVMSKAGKGNHILVFL